MKLVYFTTQIVFITLMLGVAALFLLPLLPIENNIQLRIVESGSMEPNIMTGSLVVITPKPAYQIGEVVTFKSASADVPTTHRIIESYTEAGATVFKTKGDANEEADTEAVRAEDVIGRIAVDVPYVGFILDFARQPLGFSLLILLPAFMIIFSELEKIWVEIRGRKVKAKKETEAVLSDLPLDSDSEDTNKRMVDISTPVQFRALPTLDLRFASPIISSSYSVRSSYKKQLGEWATICLVLIGSSIFVSASFLPYTASYFNDIERSVGNSLRANLLDFTVFSEANAFSFLGLNLDSTDSSVVTVVEPVAGSVRIDYDVKVEQTGGSTLFCDAIKAEMIDLPIVYTGPLLGLTAVDVEFSGPWSLRLVIDELVVGYSAADFCQVDVVYTAWHENELSGVGYHDEERVPLMFSAPGTTLAAPSAKLLELSIEIATSTDENIEVPKEDEPLAEDGIDEVVLEEEIILPVDELEGEAAPVEVEVVDEESTEVPLPIAEEEVVVEESSGEDAEEEVIPLDPSETV